MLQIKADFHIHTVLSPCAGIEMIPPLIIEESLSKGITLIAITDHNSSYNVQAVQKAAKDTPLSVLPGMEIQTKEEIHLVCLFDTIDQINELQSIVNDSLPKISNRPDYFGEQFVVDYTGDFIRREEQLLLTSTDLSLEQVWNIVLELNGLCIPAHINQKPYGLLPTLGFIPNNLPFTAMEISRHTPINIAINTNPEIKKFPLIQNSDAHYLIDINSYTEFVINNISINEIKLAFQNSNNRSFRSLSSPQML